MAHISSPHTIGGQPSTIHLHSMSADRAPGLSQTTMTNEAPTSAAAAERQMIDKVLKLLAMAEGTDNAVEAEAFSAKAAQMITDHRIDPQRLSQLDRTDQLEVRQIPLGRGAYIRARVALLAAVARAHDCQIVYQTLSTGTVGLVAGFRSDLSTVEMLYTSLHTQASSQMSEVRRGTGAATQYWRRSFLFGYAAQVETMLQRSVETTMKQHHAEERNDLLPILRERQERVKEFATVSFGRLRKGRPVSGIGQSGYAAGQHAAATRADLGHKMVAPRHGLGSGR
jgi:hypothetical protein